MARKTVTALTEKPHGRVAVSLDGLEWRTFPADAVVRSGLRAGSELDRACLRSLARELRRRKALTLAARSLRHRDLSARRLRERLARGGIAPSTQDEAVDTLARAGLLDDERFARARAEALAERNMGDAAIRYDLEQHGVDPDLVERAFEELAPERYRAARVVSVRGASPATARYLSRRGFGSDAVEDAVGVHLAPDA